jgi:hypothetical protein
MKRICIGIATVIVLMLMVHNNAIAQSILSSISGTVTDPSGHVVPGAEVVAHETATGVDRSLLSNSVGVYSLVDLLPGTYVITVSKPGFKDERSSAIILISAQSAKFDAPLQVGNATETVEVDSTPPTMNTENGELDKIVTGQEALAAPLQRGIFGLVATDPSSVATGSTIMIGGQRTNYGNMTIDGVTTMNNIYGGTSGGGTNDQSLESIAEVKTTASNGAADTPGFASVITTSKSGTNEFHGSGFYTTDNSAFDSTPFFTPASDKLKGPELQWYGGSVGGPVVIPKLYNGHNKTFFFVTWEHRTFPLAAGEAYLSEVTLPSVNFEAGNFSQLLPGSTISNPATGLPYTNNTIGGTGPFSTISSVANAFQTNYFPAPPATFGINDYSVLLTAPEHINREDYKIDHHFSEKSILSGRYTRQYDPEPDNYTSGTSILGYGQVKAYSNAYISHTYTFNQNLVNEFRVAFAKDGRNYTAFHNGDQVLAKTGLQGVTVPPSVQGFPQVYFYGTSGIAGLAEIGSSTQDSYDYILLDNIIWQKGRHSIKAGFSTDDTRPRSASGNGTQQLGEMDFNGFASGYDYADFLLGIPSSVSLNENPPNRYNRAINTGIYGQDTWTVSPKLSVTLGLRWDYYQPPVDANDERANFDPYYVGPTGIGGGIVLPDAKAVQNISANLPTVIPGDQVEVSPAGFPGRSMLYGNKTNFGPRLGVAYQTDPRTVIRGGWGIYYGLLINAVQDNLAGGGVFGTELFATNSITNGVPAFTLPNPFSTISSSTGSQACTSYCGLVESGTDPHIKTPTSQEYNLTIERDLGHQIVGRVGYRGFNTYHLPYTIDLTIPQAGSNGNLPGNNPASNLYVSDYPLYSKVTWTESGAVSRENSLDAALIKKFGSGLNFQFAYALTKNLTDDNGAGGGNGEGDSPQNPYDLKADYGNANMISRNRFVVTTLYNLPVGKGKQFGNNMPAALDYVIGGWEASQIFVFQTGQFLTPYYTDTSVPDGLGDGMRAEQNILADNGTNLRPNCVASPRVPNGSPSQWFNNTNWWTVTNSTTGAGVINQSAAFVAPPVGQYGNCGTGIIQGPGLWSDNIGLFKSLPLGPKVHLKFEANMMNAFNHPNPANPNMNVSSYFTPNSGNGGNFGQIPIGNTQSGTQALNPTVVNANGERHIWLSMRVEF